MTSSALSASSAGRVIMDRCFSALVCCGPALDTGESQTLMHTTGEMSVVMEMMGSHLL